jgi:hypothetical protein
MKWRGEFEKIANMALACQYKVYGDTSEKEFGGVREGMIVLRLEKDTLHPDWSASPVASIVWTVLIRLPCFRHLGRSNCHQLKIKPLLMSLMKR